MISSQLIDSTETDRNFDISKIKFDKDGVIDFYWPLDNKKSAELMKNLTHNELAKYLAKIETNILLAYGVYQIEADGLDLFDYIKGDRDSIMGLPIKDIINYIKEFKK